MHGMRTALPPKSVPHHRFALFGSKFGLALFLLHQAFSQAYTTQRKVAEDGESNEETLLEESATKEAYYMGRLLEQQTELKNSRSHASCTQVENERLTDILQELREVRNFRVTKV